MGSFFFFSTDYCQEDCDKRLMLKFVRRAFEAQASVKVGRRALEQGS